MAARGDLNLRQERFNVASDLILAWASTRLRAGSAPVRPLLAWTRDLHLDGALAVAEPEKLRYRLLNVAAKISRTACTTTLRIAEGWPWTDNPSKRSTGSANYPNPCPRSVCAHAGPADRPGMRPWCLSSKAQ
jgi:hypothetical protein